MNNKIRVSEIFFSIQGEGLFVGTPSIFLRTWGCNFRCQGFGMPKGQLSNEYLTVNPSEYSSYDQLPLVHTGCDSYPSWDPRFKKLSPMRTIPDIIDQMKQLLPNQQFGPVHLVITGGEPLLGWQLHYIELIKQINECGMNLRNVTFETNGTQELDDKLVEFINKDPLLTVTFSISSKLTNSGEKWEDAIQPGVIESYLQCSNTSYFKWVCGSPEDADDVDRAIKQYCEAGIDLPIYLMAAGGTDRLYDKNKRWLAELCLQNGYRYSPRLHIDLFGNAWGT